MAFETPGQPKPMKKYGIRDWLLSKEKAGIISCAEVENQMAKNENKQERLRIYRLPTPACWGPTESLEETAGLIPEDKKTPEHQFLVRCVPKKIQSGLKMERTMGLAWPEVSSFVENLPGGKENYTVEVREHWEDDYGGIIIANGEGKVVAEVAPGNLADFETQSAEKIRSARVDFGAGGIHLEYSENALPEEKEIIIKALKFFVSGLTREELEKLKIYAEFGFSKEHGFRFFEATDDDFWTKI